MHLNATSSRWRLSYSRTFVNVVSRRFFDAIATNNTFDSQVKISVILPGFFFYFFLLLLLRQLGACNLQMHACFERSTAVFRHALERSESPRANVFLRHGIIRHVWSNGGLRSSPLSRNRELMQRIARIGYLMPGVICKCRGRLAPRRNEEERGACSSSPSVFLASLSSSLPLSFRLSRTGPS